jgi:hypothetical protein
MLLQRGRCSGKGWRDGRRRVNGATVVGFAAARSAAISSSVAAVANSSSSSSIKVFPGAKRRQVELEIHGELAVILAFAQGAKNKARTPVSRIQVTWERSSHVLAQVAMLQDFQLTSQLGGGSAKPAMSEGRLLRPPSVTPECRHLFRGEKQRLAFACILLHEPSHRERMTLNSLTRSSATSSSILHRQRRVEPRVVR